MPALAARAARLALALLAAAASAPAAAMPPDALSFDLALGARHCFRQSFAPRVSGLAELLVVDGPPGLSVSATVVDVASNELLLHVDGLSHETARLPPSRRPAARGAPRGGARPSEFRVCVTATRPKGYLPPRDSSRAPRPGETRRVFVSIRELGGEGGADGARRGDDPLESLTKRSDLRTLEETIDVLSYQLRRLGRDIGDLREREQDLAASGEYTANRILRCSILACVAIVIAGVLSSVSLDFVLAKNVRPGTMRLA